MKQLGEIAWVTRCASHMEKFYADTLARILLSFVPLMDILQKNKIIPKKIASFGAGSCSHESYLSLIYDNCTVTCYDATDSYIPPYTRLLIENSSSITFQELDFDNFNWGDLEKQFDLVISIQTLEHIVDYNSALRNICNTVIEGGYIYIDTPYYSENIEPDGQEYIEKEKARQWDVHSHYHLGFSKKKIEKRLNDIGFEIVDSGYYSYILGDNKLLNYVRNSKLFTKKKADMPFILGMVGLFLSFLQNSEQSMALALEDLDDLPHSKRSVEAIRVLARKMTAPAERYEINT